VRFAAVEDSTVVGCEDVIEQSGVSARDRLALAVFQCPKLEPARSRRRPQRTRADPGEGQAGPNDQHEGKPQCDSPSAVGGALGGFGGGHLVFVWA